MRVGEHADVFERLRTDEVAELIDVWSGLARKPDYERRPERDARHAGTNPVQQRVVLLPRAGPLHAPEDGVGGMLERQIDVLADAVALRHRGQRFIADRRRIEVEQANPFDAVDRIQIAEESCQGGALVTVVAVKRGVLRNEEQLLDTARGERARFADDGFGRTAPVVAAQRRDDAE